MGFFLPQHVFQPGYVVVQLPNPADGVQIDVVGIDSVQGAGDGRVPEERGPGKAGDAADFPDGIGEDVLQSVQGEEHLVITEDGFVQLHLIFLEGGIGIRKIRPVRIVPVSGKGGFAQEGRKCHIQ